jgi:hypothetical protein
VLFVHEVHEVRGAREEEFEAAYRDQWMPELATGELGRFLWYATQAHGSGPAYHVVTITALRDGGAWEELVRRVQRGDLRDWARGLDELRHDLRSKLLVPVSWSPMQEVDFDSVPTDVSAHEQSLYMEDTGWPHAPLDDYVAFWESDYYAPMRQRGGGLLDIQAVFQVAFGSGRHKEAILMQKITSYDGLMQLLTADTPPRYRAPGQFMHDALGYRDRWESKLLRTSVWSPFY